jgi:sec-independent protein translocase protein TatB
MADSLILMVLALVVFGPRRLPQIGRQIGKLMYEFRKASNDFKFQMEEELRISEEADRRKKDEEERARNLALNPPAPAIEAQAAIGADDQASVSAPAGTYSADATTPAAADTPAEPATGLISEESRIRYPRINPPATGEPIPAARPGAAAASPEPAAGGESADPDIAFVPPASETPAADIPAAVPSIASPETPQPVPPSHPTPGEPVSHHG